MQCYTCFGLGYVTCPACNGQGGYFQFVAGKNQFFVCYQCGGKRQITCQTCGGVGVITVSGNGCPPPPKTEIEPVIPPDLELLNLDGRWKGFMSRCEFVRDNGGYLVTVYNIFGGKIATERATINGNTLILTYGVNTAYLQWSDGKLKGEMRLAGLLPWPCEFQRV